MVTCGRSQSHRCMGKRVLVLHSPATKWFSHVCIARSAALRPCMCGGTSWNSTWLSLLNFWAMLMPHCWASVLWGKNLVVVGIGRVFGMLLEFWGQFSCKVLWWVWRWCHNHAVLLVCICIPCWMWRETFRFDLYRFFQCVQWWQIRSWLVHCWVLELVRIQWLPPSFWLIGYWCVSDWCVPSLLLPT